MRVPLFLDDNCVPFETIVHPPAFTATKRARFLHVPGKQLAKCVLLAGPDGHLLAILPATHHIDLEVLSDKLGGPVPLAPLKTSRRSLEIANGGRWCPLDRFTAWRPYLTIHSIPTPRSFLRRTRTPRPSACCAATWNDWKSPGGLALPAVKKRWTIKPVTPVITDPAPTGPVPQSRPGAPSTSFRPA